MNSGDVLHRQIEFVGPSFCPHHSAYLLLQRAGYETAYIGKWHMGNDDSARPGFDHWVSMEGQGTSFDPILNVDGERQSFAGHTTAVLKVEDRLGTLEAKKIADVVTAKGDPLEDITLTRNVDFGMKEGVVYKSGGLEITARKE